MRRESTVGSLLSRAFAVMVTLILVSGLAELAVVLLQDRAVQRLTDEVQPLQLANADMRAVLTDAQRGVRGYLLTGNEEMLDTYRLAKTSYDEAAGELRRLGDGPDAAAVADQIARADRWWDLAGEQSLEPPRSTGAVDYAQRGTLLFQEFIDANDDLRRGLDARAGDLEGRAVVLRWTALGVIVVLTAGAALISVLTAVRTSRRITRPLGVVVDTLDRVRAGEPGARADVPHGPAEIRAVAEAVNAAADQSERIRRHEEQLTARLQSLETAKTDFMSTVSHELRTPLTSISGYAELMSDAPPGELGAGQRRMLEVIARNARRLRDLIEDILTLSKIETGEFSSERIGLDLAAIVERAVAAIGPAAAKGQVGVHVELRGPLPVRGDGAQLERVLSNLLTNAVKFTPPQGTVTVRAEQRDGHVVLAVADTGMGIPADEQQALFVRFFRASNAIRQAVPGTGLGLAIIRMIVDNHGGTIDIASTENVGTTVTVRLPVEQAAARPDQVGVVPALRVERR